MKSLSDYLNRYSTKIISKANQRIRAHEAITGYNVRAMTYNSVNNSNIYEIKFSIKEYLDEAIEKINTE